MKKIFRAFLCTLLLISFETSAQTIVSNKKEGRTAIAKITSFPDYFPIAYTAKSGNYSALNTVFDQAMEQVAAAGNFKFEYIPEENHKEAVTAVRRGEIDVLLGMYYDTKQYSGLEYIFPAVLNNPVYIIMLPQNIEKVSKPEDLKNLRGLYITQEYFSDYMQNNFESYHMQPVETPLRAYEKLFTGEADYIAGGYYYNYAEICRLGLKNFVSFSKAPLWNMPLFIGVSKASRDHAVIGKVLRKYAADKDFQQSIRNALKNLVQQAEAESLGVVPPMFVKTEDNTITPADEAAAKENDESDKQQGK